VLRGRCACNAVAYEVADEFVTSFNCTARGAAQRQAGTLIDEPALKPTAHIYVGSKASWYEILDDLRQYDEHPWS
jgi:hypothetical protein